MGHAVVSVVVGTVSDFDSATGESPLTEVGVVVVCISSSWLNLLIVAPVINDNSVTGARLAVIVTGRRRGWPGIRLRCFR